MLDGRFISKKTTEYFQSVIQDAISSREKEGIVRPDMIQLLIQAKKSNLEVEKTEEKAVETEDDANKHGICHYNYYLTYYSR